MASRRPPGAMPLDEGPWPARDTAARPTKPANPQTPRGPGALPLDPLPRPVPATSFGRQPTEPGHFIDDHAGDDDKRDAHSDAHSDNSGDDGARDTVDGDGPLGDGPRGDDRRASWDELGPTESFTPPPMTTPSPKSTWDDLGPTESLTVGIPTDVLSSTEAVPSSSAPPSSSSSSSSSSSPSPTSAPSSSMAATPKAPPLEKPRS